MFHTVRYLRPIQIYSRIKFKLYQPSVDNNNLPGIRVACSYWKTPIQHKASILSRWKFRFLNEEHSLNNSDDWDSDKFSKLWRYNLHYFDDLNASGAHFRAEWHHELLIKWVQDNPPVSGTGWEPYPTSLRIVNWIKWSLAGNELPVQCSHSLAIQAHWLSKRLEFHILGNHLVANAKALIFAGLFFEGEKADKWLASGLTILRRELQEQILADGGHFERSPMYHAIVLEDLLDLINVSSTFERQIQEEQLVEWNAVIIKMFNWLQSMLHPDGQITFFNDAAFGVAATFIELDEYAKRLGIQVGSISESLVNLCDSGYVRVEKGPAVGFIDAAPVGPDYLPGHAHADTLSFELSLFGQRVFVNSGISQYGNDLVRQNQRSTALHNTVSIDGFDSSEVWAGFRVARRAYPGKLNIKKDNSEYKISCSHNGYRRLPGKCIHKREWNFSNKSLRITDKITGIYKSATANFYLYPDIEVNTDDEHTGVFNLVTSSGEALRFSVKNADKVALISSKWYPEFGMSLNNKCISVSFTLPEIAISLVW